MNKHTYACHQLSCLELNPQQDCRRSNIYSSCFTDCAMAAGLMHISWYMYYFHVSMYVKKWSNAPISNHFWFPLMPKVIRPIKGACIPTLMARLERLDLAVKIRELSLIIGFIMGGSKFFSNFLSGLSRQRHPRARACVWIARQQGAILGTFEIGFCSKN